MKKTVFVLAGALILTGCQTGGPKQTGGTLIGAAAGGLIGAQIGGGTGRVVAGSLGAVGGALLGSHVGKELDEKDQLEAERAAESRYPLRPAQGKRYEHYPYDKHHDVRNSAFRGLSHEEMHKRGIVHRHR